MLQRERLMAVAKLIGIFQKAQMSWFRRSLTRIAETSYPLAFLLKAKLGRNIANERLVKQTRNRFVVRPLCRRRARVELGGKKSCQAARRITSHFGFSEPFPKL